MEIFQQSALKNVIIENTPYLIGVVLRFWSLTESSIYSGLFWSTSFDVWWNFYLKDLIWNSNGLDY